MKCDGKCHLKQQLEQQESQERKLPVNFKTGEMPLFVGTEAVNIGMGFVPVTPLAFFDYNAPTHTAMSKGIFHPPQVI